MKSYCDFVFQYCVFSIQRIQLCDTKIGRPKKIAGILSDPKNSGNFAKPRNIAEKFANLEKYDLAKFQTQKNRTSIPVKILTCAPPPRVLIMAMFTRERYCTVIVIGLIFGTEKLTVHTGPVLGPVHTGTLSYRSRTFRAKTSKSKQ